MANTSEERAETKRLCSLLHKYAHDICCFLGYEGKEIFLDKFPDVRHYLTDDVILYLGHYRVPGLSLETLYVYLNGDNRQLFCEKVFALRKKLPKRALMNIYLKISPSSNYFDTLALREQPERGTQEEYCESAIINTKINPPQKLPKGIEEAIKNNSYPAFAMYSEMYNLRITFPLLNFIVECGATTLMGELMKAKRIPAKILNKLLFYAVVHLPETTLIPLLESIEDGLPGQIKNCKDAAGKNLLWYAICNKKTYTSEVQWNDPGSKMTEYLLKLGCDPDNLNALDVSWRYCLLNANLSRRSQRTEEFEGVEKIVDSWIGCYGPGNVTPVTLRELPRSHSELPLNKKFQQLLGNNFRELIWNFEPLSCSTLPQEWRKYVKREDVALPAIPLEGKRCLKWAMKSYHHPRYNERGFDGVPGILTAIPKKPADETIADDDAQRVAEIMKTGLRLYHPAVRKYWINNALPGYETLRFLSGIPREDIADPLLAEAIAQDDAKLFASCCRNKEQLLLTPGVIDAVFRQSKGRISHWLFDNSEYFNTLFPPRILAFYAAGCLDDQSGKKLLTLLINRDHTAKLCEESCDCFGSNLLFHTIFNRNISCFAPDCELVKFLKYKKCSVKHINKFGIAFHDIEAVLDEETFTQREKYLEAVRKALAGW
ncbi:MAG: hypothetical protein IKB99_08390 [Lentisphaeria bacterium]|nr:hypothetical protein [Lentisphaeria bacterium]